MGIFKKGKSTGGDGATSSVQTGSVSSHPFSQLNGYSAMSNASNRVYAALREGVPIIDSAINKIIRLMGGFSFETGNAQVNRKMETFFDSINVGGNQKGISAFADNYMDQLLTYGSAIGEMVMNENGICALYNGELEYIDVKRKNDSMDLEFFNTSSGSAVRLKNEEALLFSVLNPQAGRILGTSLLRGLPFVSDILLKIYNTIGTNWDRVGNLRYAVTYKPQNDSVDRGFAKERANQMARAWKDAMSSKDSVKDFVAVGDVQVRVIGADNQVLDSEIPVRQLLEQITAKLGVPPFLLGLSWSSTERMSAQQADILTSEIDFYRRTLEPAIMRICAVWQRLSGFDGEMEIEWDNVSLQDETELALARLRNAQAQALETENAESEGKI